MDATSDKLDDAILELSRSDGTLTTLKLFGNFSVNQVKDEGAGRLAQALATSTTLTTLDLYKNQVGAEGAGRLAESLASNFTLTSLDLYGNQMGDEGAGRLAEALPSNSTLTTLDLSWNQLGDEGAGWLAEALATNSSLIEVHFDCDRNTRRLVDVHLDRNKRNLEKKSASLFLMLLPLVLLDGDELSLSSSSAFKFQPHQKNCISRLSKRSRHR